MVGAASLVVVGVADAAAVAVAGTVCAGIQSPFAGGCTAWSATQRTCQDASGTERPKLTEKQRAYLADVEVRAVVSDLRVVLLEERLVEAGRAGDVAAGLLRLDDPDVRAVLGVVADALGLARDEVRAVLVDHTRVDGGELVAVKACEP